MSITEIIRKQANNYAAKRDEDIDSLRNNPMNRAQWCDGMFKNIAFADVFARVAVSLEKDTGETEEEKVERLVTYATSKAMLRFRPQSSATCSN